jgi:hypothetical protein
MDETLGTFILLLYNVPGLQLFRMLLHVLERFTDGFLLPLRYVFRILSNELNGLFFLQVFHQGSCVIFLYNDV